MANHSILGELASAIYPVVIIGHKSPAETVVQGSVWCCPDPEKHSLIMSKSESGSGKLKFSASLQTFQTGLNKLLSFSYLSC